MRISLKERAAILETLKAEMGAIKYKVFLFGSRADDSKKGGDIDLLLEVDEQDYLGVLANKSALKFELEAATGDQRVDLTIATSKTLNSDPFLKSIQTNLVRIHQDSSI